jgi:hypothetical protein
MWFNRSVDMGGVPPIPPLESLGDSLDNSSGELDNIYGTYEQEMAQFNQPALDMEMFTERAFSSHTTEFFSTSNFLSATADASDDDVDSGVPPMDKHDYYYEGEHEGEDTNNNTRKKGRGKSSEKYKFGKLLESNWYMTQAAMQCRL